MPCIPSMIVLRLVGGHSEGQWMAVDRLPIIVARSLPLSTMDVDEREPTASPSFITVKMVATGSVEWRDDDVPAEVYVPEDKLHIWKLEHDID